MEYLLKINILFSGDNVIINKLRYGAINNKKIIVFLLGLSIIGILCGTIFITILSKSDHELVKNYMVNYLKNINSIDIYHFFKSNLLTTLLCTFFIWLLGISAIGIPIIILIYFSKLFILGFSISSFIISYKTKGLLLALIYIFPNQIIFVLMYTLLCLYGIKISNNFIYNLFNKKSINQSIIMKKYLRILVFCLIIGTICTIYDSYILPIIFKKISNFIKI